MAFFPANFMLQSPQHHQQEDQDHHHHNHNHNNNNTPSSLNHPNILSSSCTTTTTHHPQDFHHALSSGLMGKRSMSFSGIEMHHHDHQDLNINGGDDDLSDDGSQAGEKKRRLNLEQVKTLEKNFELGNKLEPERKMQLARALGLQPRQIAIWFQNRRARWKTKQLEKDYDLLKRQFEAIKADNDSLQAHNKKLHAEIVALKTREVVPTESINLNKETEGSCSNRSENSSDLHLDISRTPAIDSPLSSHPNGRPLFPTSMNIRQQTSMVQLLQNSSRPDHLQCPTKVVDPTAVQDEAGGFCNMFCTIDDQSGFWPWPEHQQFH